MKLYEFSEELNGLYQRTRHGVVRVEQYDENGETVQAASGIAWPQQGIIITVSHPFDDQDAVRVRHGGDEPIHAKVRGWDNRYDLAVLEVEGATVPIWKDWAELEELRPAELVLVLGFEEIRLGMVSRTAEEQMNRWGGVLKPWVEIDAGLSSTQAGGALLDRAGRFVGMNSTQPGSHGQTIGYGQLQHLVRSILSSGSARPAYLGIRTAPGRGADTRPALVVTHVDADSPAEAAGLMSGDLLREFGGVALQHPRGLFMALRTMSSGDIKTLRILRAGEELQLSVTLGEGRVG